jgi:hypothetical protein
MAARRVRPKKGSPVSSARGAYEIMKQRRSEMASCNTAKNAVEEHERVALESELGRLAGHGVPIRFLSPKR